MRCYESITFPASLSMTLKAKHKPCALRKNVISWQIKEFDPDHVVILLIKILQSSTSHVFLYNISGWTKLNHLWYEKTLLHIGRVTLIHPHGLFLLLRYMPILQSQPWPVTQGRYGRTLSPQARSVYQVMFSALKGRNKETWRNKE